MSTFGERLRALRRMAGLSQEALAGEELSTSYISLLEADKRTPSDAVVHALAARLGCSRDQLVEGKESEREQRIQLELAYAKLAIEHGESLDASTRLRRLLEDDGVPSAARDEVSLLLGTALQRRGENGEAVALLEPLLARACTGDARVSVIDAAQALCRSYLDVGDFHQAVTLGEAALDAARRQHLNETSDFFRLAATLVGAYLDMGDFLRARIWTDQLIEEAIESGQVAGQAALYWNAAITAELEGRLDQALHLCERALARMSELDNLRDYARLRLATAQILLAFEVPDIAKAKLLLHNCLPDLSDHGSIGDHSAWNRALSMVLLHEGDLSGAEGRARQALDLLGTASSEKRALALMSLHDALYAQERTDEADEYLRQATEAVEGVGGGRTQALLRRELADRLAAAGHSALAIQHYQHALDAAGVRDASRNVRQAARRASTISLVSGPSLGH